MYFHVGGAKACTGGLVFSTAMSDDNFLVYLKKEGLKEVDCKKLSGKYIIFTGLCLTFRNYVCMGLKIKL